MDQEWCNTYDANVMRFLEKELGCTLESNQRSQVHLPLKKSGIGLMSVSRRRSAAFLGSWEQCFSSVCTAVNASSAEALLARAPQTQAALETAAAELRQNGFGTYQPNWARLSQQPTFKQQKTFMAAVNEYHLKELLAQSSEDDSVDIRSAGGVGAGAFLLPPTLASHVMSDVHLKIALRRRLRVHNLYVWYSCHALQTPGR